MVKQGDNFIRLSCLVPAVPETVPVTFTPITYLLRTKQAQEGDQLFNEMNSILIKEKGASQVVGHGV